MYNNDPKYMNPPEAGLASLLSSRGRNGDSVLVHMAPEELQGLQSLAMAHGGQLTVNPETGLYEASFLKKILPMIAGAVLPSIPGVGQFAKTIGFGSEALGTALLVGGATGLIEGDLKKGLMAGLGAYSGATLSEGLKAASIAGRPDEAIAGATPVAEAAKAGQAVDAARGTVGATAEATRLSDVGGVFTPKMTTPPAISGISIKPVDYTPYTPPPPTPSVMGGISALMRPEGRTAFMGAMGGGFQSPLAQNLSKYAVMTGVADALTPQPKAMPMGGGASEDIVYIPGAFNPQYGSGKDQPFQLPGRYYKRTPQGLVPYNPFQLAPGARGFAQGGSVQSPMQGPIKVSPYAMPTEDPNVLATRAYIEELNRRARNPYAVGGGGMGGAGGLGSFGTPGTYQPSDGGVVGGGESGGSLGAIAGGIAANYLINKGIGAGVDYLRDKFGGEQQQPYKEPISDSLQAVDHATLPTTMAAVDQLSALNVAPPKTYSYQVEEVPDVAPQPAAPTTPATSAIPYTLGALNALSPFAAAPSAIPVVGEPVYDALGQVTGFKYPDGTIEPVEGYQRQPDTLDADLQAKTRVGGDMSAPLSSYLSAGSSGLAGLASLGSAAKTGLTSIIPLDPATGAVQTFLSPGSSAAANAAAAESAKAAGAEVAGAGTGAGAASKIIPGLQAALGLYEAYKGIESGEEGRAALGGFGAGAGIATLAGATPGFGALAAAGPIGLAAAAIAAIGASMVNTKEFGDVALRNYWNAVDQGRGIGETDPVELAQGFINFYRTNKNNFAGQEKYGRTGNEDFVYDMTQVINNAVKDGKIDKNVDAATMYQQVVQPWLNSMGSGPQNEDAKRIQDFMITDLINSFMQGKPISNAQVKGDSKFKIVSEKPVYAGAAQPTPELALPTTPDIQDLIRQAAPPVQLGGDEYPIGTPMPVRATTPVPEEPYYMPEYDRFNPFAEDYASMPFERMSRYAGGGAIGEGYNFGFAGGGMPPQPEYRAGGKLLRGRGDGMSDDIPAVIRGKGEQRAALADGEFVIPADVVSHLGNGSTNAGAKKLYQMMARVRQARTGKKKQAPAVNMNRYMPA